MKTASQSRIKTWLFCPAAYYRQYILGLSPYNPKFDFGTDFHKMVEMYHKRLERDFERDHRTGEIIPGPDGKPAKEYILDVERIKHYAALYPADWFDVPKGTPLEILEKLARPGEVFDDTKPLSMVERRLEVTLIHPFTGQALQVPLTLVIDGLRLDESGRRLSDLKTSINSWSQATADADMQATLYLYVWWQLTGEILPFYFVVARKNPGPRTKPMQELQTTRVVEQFATLFDEMYATIEEILTATTYPCYCAGNIHAIKGVTDR